MNFQFPFHLIHVGFYRLCSKIKYGGVIEDAGYLRMLLTLSRVHVPRGVSAATAIGGDAGAMIQP